MEREGGGGREVEREGGRDESKTHLIVTMILACAILTSIIAYIYAHSDIEVFRTKFPGKCTG